MEWRKGLEAPGSGEVHVWRATTLVPPQGFDERWAVLDSTERARADRFRVSRDRERFVAARAFLRALLSCYTGVPPAAIRFSVLAHGKPALAEPGGPHFNLSHSHEAAVCAVAGREVGIDIEQVRPLPDAMQIAARFFSAEERDALAIVPPERRDRAFFACWTRKEAYVKATGSGLLVPLDRFSVTVEPGDAVLLRGAGTAAWSIRDIDAGAGYAGAVAVEMPDPDVRERAWEF